jgi:hypothetical protein
MSKATTLSVGLDSHKEFISVAHVEWGNSSPYPFLI